MEEDTEQTGQGGMMDDLMSRGRDAAGQAMNDPEMRDRIAGQAEERFGNVPGMSQAASAFRGMGGSTSGREKGGETTGEYGSGHQTADYSGGSEDSSGYDRSGDTSYTDESDTESSDSSRY